MSSTTLQEGLSLADTVGSSPACMTGVRVEQFLQRLCDALAAEPDEEGVSRAVVLSFPAHLRACAALLGELRADGGLHMVGQFGYRGLKDFPDPFPISDDWPISRAVRETRPLVFPTGDDVARTFPLITTLYATPRPLAVTALGSPGRAVGVLGMTFDDTIIDPELVLALLGAARHVLGLYVSLAWAGRSRSDRADVDLQPRPTVGLTARQLTILGLLRDRLSNAQIAVRIGYSESTVRQETMAIYRALGVSDRYSAVPAARSRGLID